MWRQARSVNQKLFPQFESLKQGRLSKVFDMYRDYTQALKDTVGVIKEKPIKCTVYGTLLTLSVYCNHRNPDMGSYRQSLLDASNEHTLLSDSIRNKKSADEVKKLMKYVAEDRLQLIHFGVFSVILLNDHSKYHDAYDKHCSTIQSRWIYIDEWKERIKDVGFLDKWYFLERNMIDFDVNEDEFN
ncbi:mitochondrial import inner membrane translocase subunit Tim29-like [Clytia hemisphaerica]|uniref:Uncharacterized protein n=1 Tax=Clytia hemisphaerica TaxID=252671 RepID=A0A7M6DQ22_9CNID